MDYRRRARLKIYAHVETLALDADPALTELVTDSVYKAKLERIFRLRLEAFDWNCQQHITPGFTEPEMGRAIVREPEVFLFDEPLSNLDPALQVQVRTEIKKLHQALSTTTVHATHDQVKAMTLADRVAVMNAGKIEQVGAPQELYHSPKTRFVAGFIGSPNMNFMSVRLAASDEGRLELELPDRAKLPVHPSRAERYAPA